MVFLSAQIGFLKIAKTLQKTIVVSYSFEGGSNEKKNDYGGKNVKTGDDSRPAVWITLMIISLICLCAAISIRCRRT